MYGIPVGFFVGIVLAAGRDLDTITD